MLLHGYISNTEPQEDETGDIVVESSGAFIGTAKELALDAAKATEFETRLVGTVGTVPFVALNIMKKTSEGEGTFQATWTTLGSTGAGIATTILITGMIAGPPGIIIAGITAGLVSYYSDKFLEYIANGGAEEIINDAMDTINSTSFDINTNGIVDIVSSAASGNLIPLLHGIQQGDIRIGSTTVYTHLTNSSVVAAFGNALKSIATTRVTVLSPVGNYEAQLVNDPNAGNFIGSSSNDTLIGNSEDDIFTGGDGDDDYNTGGGYDIINDSDGQGEVTFSGKKLTGASKYPTETVWKDGSITYEWAGTGTNLTVKNGTDTLVIENFHNGDLGIRLKMEEPTPPRHYTTEEVNTKWYNILGFWQASNWPAISSYGSITFDTLSWSIGLTNLDTNPDGEGKWLPTFVLGNVPNLSCPIVPFDNTKILEFNQTLTQVA